MPCCPPAPLPPPTHAPHNPHHTNQTSPANSQWVIREGERLGQQRKRLVSVHEALDQCIQPRVGDLIPFMSGWEASGLVITQTLLGAVWFDVLGLGTGLLRFGVGCGEDQGGGRCASASAVRSDRTTDTNPSPGGRCSPEEEVCKRFTGKRGCGCLGVVRDVGDRLQLAAIHQRGVSGGGVSGGARGLERSYYAQLRVACLTGLTSLIFGAEPVISATR